MVSGAVFLIPNNTILLEDMAAGSNLLNSKSPNTNNEVVQVATEISTEGRAKKQSDLNDNPGALGIFTASFTREIDEETIPIEAKEVDAKRVSESIDDGATQKTAPLKESLVKVLLPGHSERWKNLTLKSESKLLLVYVHLMFF